MQIVVVWQLTHARHGSAVRVTIRRATPSMSTSGIVSDERLYLTYRVARCAFETRVQLL